MTLTDLANLALSRLSYPMILNSLEDGSFEVRQIKLVLHHAIEQIVNQHDWQECTKTATVYATLPVPDGDPKQYQRPDDFIRFVTRPAETYETRGNVLVIPNGGESITLRYVFLNLQPSTYSPELKECILLRLCADLAETLLKNSQQAEMYRAELNARALPHAKYRQSTDNHGQRRVDTNAGILNSVRDIGGFGGLYGNAERRTPQ